jgi:signal transduction histidine kinase
MVFQSKVIGRLIVGGTLYRKGLFATLLSMKTRENAFSLPKWLIPYPFAWVSTLLYLGVLILFFYYEQFQDPPFTDLYQRRFLLVVFVGLLLLLDRIEYRLPLWTAWGLIALRLGLIEIIAQVDDFNFSPYIFLFAPFFAWMSKGSRAGYLVALLAWLRFFYRVTQADPEWYTIEILINYLLTFSVGLVFTLTMAKTVAQEKVNRQRAEDLLDELEIAHRQLKEYAQEVSYLAAAEERNRLARDIHDTVGHYLTVINVQLEKALMLRQKKPQEADQAIVDAKRMARETLQDVRQSVSTLRHSQEIFSLIDLLHKLADNIRSPRMQIDVNIQGEETLLSKQGLMTLYRVAQEGLTNVQKHARASHVTMTLMFDESSSRLSITDDGCGFDPTTAFQGECYGLVGIRERLGVMGGTLQIESYPDQGTHLLITIPRPTYGRRG